MRPNIIFVITDDQGYADLGCHGNKYIKTPNIDEFYKESVRLEDYHVGPTCAPTRAGLLTGHYANSTGVWHTIGGRSLLRKDEWTLATALKENGYNTGIFGKWHLGDSYPYRAMDRGFNKSVVHGGGGISQSTDYWGNDYFDDTYMVDGEEKAFKGYCTDVFFDEAIDFIKEQDKDEPFFCYIPTNAPHAPYNVEKEYYEMYKDNDAIPDDRARFFGMITNIDDNFGRLKAEIEKLGIMENTILVFTTDNGSSASMVEDENEFCVEGYNAGFRGLKGSEYEGGHRVPFFMRYDGLNINKGEDIKDICANVDVMPTLLDFCGIETDREFDGISLVDRITNKTSKLDDRIIVTDSQRITVPMKWKQSCAMFENYRLINGEELYDIEADREQRNNIADSNLEMVEKLRNGYEHWWVKVTERTDEEIPLYLGDYETYLSPHDVRGDIDECAFSQGRIRRGQIAYSYWEILVEEDGEYEFDIRRWPRSHERKIKEGIEGDDIEWNREGVQPGFEGLYTGGNALDIVSVEVSFDNEKVTIPVDDGMHNVVYKTKLSKGNKHLKTIFVDEEGYKRVAYFVYAKKVG